MRCIISSPFDILLLFLAIHLQLTVIVVETKIIGGDLFLLTGDTINITCRLEDDDTKKFNSSRMFFVTRQRSIDRKHYTIIDDHTVRLLVTDVTPEDAANYECHVLTDSNQQSFIDEITVKVGYIPVLPSSNPFEYWCDDLDKMTFRWCVNKTTNSLTSWVLKWSVNDDEYHSAWNVCKLSNNDTDQFNCYMCEWHVDDDTQSFEPASRYYVSVEAHSRFIETYTGRLSINMTVSIDPWLSVKPSKVDDVKVKPLNRTAFLVLWRYPKKLNHSMRRLNFSIAWSGLSETKQELVEARGSLVEEHILTNLIPNTEYNISIRCHPAAGGFWSGPVLVTATTPEVDFAAGGNFRRLNSSLVEIFWEKEHADVARTIDVFDLQGQLMGTVKCEPMSCRLQLNIQNSYWLKLSSDDGRPAVIFIPNHTQSLSNIASIARELPNGTLFSFRWRLIGSRGHPVIGISPELSCQETANFEQSSSLSNCEPDVVKTRDTHYALAVHTESGQDDFGIGWQCVYVCHKKQASQKLDLIIVLGLVIILPVAVISMVIPVVRWARRRFHVPIEVPGPKEGSPLNNDGAVNNEQYYSLPNGQLTTCDDSLEHEQHVVSFTEVTALLTEEREARFNAESTSSEESYAQVTTVEAPGPDAVNEESGDSMDSYSRTRINEYLSGHGELIETVGHEDRQSPDQPRADFYISGRTGWLSPGREEHEMGLTGGCSSGESSPDQEQRETGLNSSGIKNTSSRSSPTYLTGKCSSSPGFDIPPGTAAHPLACDFDDS